MWTGKECIRKRNRKALLQSCCLMFAYFLQKTILPQNFPNNQISYYKLVKPFNHKNRVPLPYGFMLGHLHYKSVSPPIGKVCVHLFYRQHLLCLPPRHNRNFFFFYWFLKSEEANGLNLCFSVLSLVSSQKGF
jgi:hypothetical protein